MTLVVKGRARRSSRHDYRRREGAHPVLAGADSRENRFPSFGILVKCMCIRTNGTSRVLRSATTKSVYATTPVGNKGGGEVSEAPRSDGTAGLPFDRIPRIPRVCGV